MAGMLERLRLSGRKGYRIATFLLRHRYLLFALLINMPGNSVLGGGGGIALVSGFARLYRWPPFPADRGRGVVADPGPGIFRPDTRR